MLGSRFKGEVNPSVRELQTGFSNIQNKSLFFRVIIRPHKPVGKWEADNSRSSTSKEASVPVLPEANTACKNGSRQWACVA